MDKLELALIGAGALAAAVGAIVKGIRSSVKWGASPEDDRPAIDRPSAVFADAQSLDFRLLFEKSPEAFLVLRPSLYIVAASDEYLRATMTTRNKIVGRHIFDAFPDDNEKADGVSNLRTSLEFVLSNRIPHSMGIQKYPIRRPDGEWENRHWKPRNSPIMDDAGNIKYIIHHVHDVTAMIIASSS